jgi:flagellar motor switch protein FliG
MPPEAAETKLPEEKDFSGLERTALLLLGLGEKHAAEVLRHMGPKEVQEIGMAMANLPNITIPMMREVLEEFIDSVGSHTSLRLGADDYLRKLLVTALGPDKASGIIDRILIGRESKGLDQLKWLEPRTVAEMIRAEHPQIQAIVLSFLDPDQAGKVLAEFPESVRADVMLRLATLDGIQPSALEELDEMLAQQFAGQGAMTKTSVGGVKKAADILNCVDGTIEAQLMDAIKEVDEELSQEIQDSMFVFDHLMDVDDRGMQTLLREVSSDQLLLALRGASEELREKIFRNMSSRAAEMLKDDLEAGQPVKLSEVEASQKEILIVARRLSDAGEIALGGSGGDEYV